jgi:uncharacterized protein
MTADLLNRDVKPWYRQAWPWFLISFPATAVIAGLITLWIAIVTDEGQVISDYYKEGRAVHESVERLEKAKALGLSANVHLQVDRLSVHLASDHGAALPSVLVVTVVRPAQGDQDQVLRLSGYNGRYEGALAELGLGHWRVYLEDESRTWRMNGAAHLPDQAQFRILPSQQGR